MTGRRCGSAALALVLAAFVPVAALAAGPTVERAWSRAMAVPGVPGAIFATIRGGDTSDLLVGVDTKVAATATLHRMDMDGEAMRMRPTKALRVPAHGELVLDPGGDHVMLDGLSRPLVQGETFPATFRFAHGAPVTVIVKVGRPGADEPPK